MHYKRQTPEELAAKRAYVARGQRIKSGAMPGLLESDNRTVRADVRTLIDEALAKRRQAQGPVI
jgi:hypothetical protein